MRPKPIIIKSIHLSVIVALVLCLSVMSYFTYVYLRNKRHNKDIYDNKGRLVYLTYGFPLVPITENAQRVTANRWGFTYKSVAGCLVTRELMDSVGVHNSLVSGILIKSHGRSWGHKFDDEVLSEYKREESIDTIIRNLTYVKKKDTLLKKEGNGLHLKMDPIPGTTEYDVEATGWLISNNTPKWVNYYRLRVDYQSGAVVLISNKIEVIK